MAYVPQTQVDEEEQRRQDQLRAASGVPGVGGAGAPALPAGANPSPTSGSSGNFTDLQRYLTENQSQAGDLAQKVAGTVTAAGDEAKTAADTVAAQGKSQIEAGRVPADQGLMDEAAKNPTSVDSDAAKKAAFQKEATATYTGPAGLENVQGFQDAQDKVRQAQEKAGLTGTEAGRTTLLQDMGGPGYGQGKADLNQLLLSGDPNAAGIVSAAAAPYKDLQGYLTAKSDDARTAAANAAAEAAATAKGVQDRFSGPGGVIPAWGANLDARVAAAQTGAGESFDAAANKILSGQPLTDQELALMGLSQADVADLYKNMGALKTDYGQTPDLSTYIQRTGSPGLITRENFATDQDYAEALALADLTGRSDPALLSAATRGQAGTAQTDLGNFSKEGLDYAKSILKAQDDQLIGPNPEGRILAEEPTKQMQDAYARRGYKFEMYPVPGETGFTDRWVAVPL